MMQHEFEKRIGKEISAEDFELINIVYLYYPGIDDKDQIAALYKQFGWVVIEDMLGRANKIMDIGDSIRKLEQVIARLKIESMSLLHGNVENAKGGQANEM